VAGYQYINHPIAAETTFVQEIAGVRMRRAQWMPDEPLSPGRRPTNQPQARGQIRR